MLLKSRGNSVSGAVNKKRTDALSKSCLVSEPFVTVVDSLAFDNVQALERSDCVQTRLIVGIASRISCVALVYVFAFLGIDVFSVADGTSKGR